MRKATVPIALLFLGISVSAGFLISVSAEEGLIPSWIKSIAGFWANDQIGDSEFIAALQFLIKEGILVVSEEEQKTQTVQEETKIEQASKSVDSSTLRSSNADWVFLEVRSEEDHMELKISLRQGETPESGKYVAADGFGTIKIVNSDDETVYSGTVQVREEDFGWYTRIFTGEEMYLAIKTIPFDDIKKSESASGTVYFKFETKEGSFDEFDFDVDYALPTYSVEEISKLFEEQYMQNSILVNKKISKGGFEVTVQRVGFVKQQSYAFNEVEEFFRVDIAVKNISNEKEYATLGGLAILDNKNNQYDTAYGGTLDTFRELYPGVTSEGYVLFERIPDSASSIRVVFELGYDSRYNPHEYNFNISLIG